MLEENRKVAPSAKTFQNCNRRGPVLTTIDQTVSGVARVFARAIKQNFAQINHVFMLMIIIHVFIRYILLSASTLMCTGM